MAEDRSKPFFNPRRASDILAEELQPIDWVWEKYIATGDLFLFVAYMKVGKSTFTYPLAIAVARGIPFLGYPTKKGGVLALALEENPHTQKTPVEKARDEIR